MHKLREAVGSRRLHMLVEKESQVTAAVCSLCAVFAVLLFALSAVMCFYLLPCAFICFRVLLFASVCFYLLLCAFICFHVL